MAVPFTVAYVETSVYELGERFAVARQTVSWHLHRHDVSMRQRGLSPEQIDEAVRLYEAVWSLARIGERASASTQPPCSTD